MPTNLSSAVIKKILAKFGMIDQVEAILPQQTGYRNTVLPFSLKNKKKMALIIYKDEPDVLRKIKLANWLSGQLNKNGWPTRIAWRVEGQEIVQVVHKSKKRFCCIYNYLPGATISWENYTKKHLKLVGQVLGLLHQEMSEIEDLPHNLLIQECFNLEVKVTEMSKYFMEEGVRQALEQKLKVEITGGVFQKQLRLVKQLASLPHQQPLHLDFVRGNLLFRDDIIDQDVQDSRFCLQDNSQLNMSGILDFEKAALGPPVLELARTLSFLLVDCKYKSTDQIIKHFLHLGYVKRAQQPLPSAKLLGTLVKLYLTIDFYHFLLHSPYESLEENEHFVRTRKLVAPHLFSNCSHSSTLL